MVRGGGRILSELSLEWSTEQNPFYVIFSRKNGASPLSEESYTHGSFAVKVCSKWDSFIQFEWYRGMLMLSSLFYGMKAFLFCLNKK